MLILQMASSRTRYVNIARIWLTDLFEYRWFVRLGFVTQNKETKSTYVTKHVPSHPELYSKLRQVCVRSLSCEVSHFENIFPAFSIPC